MKKLTMIAGCVSLAACSGADAPAEGEAETGTEAVTAEATAAEGLLGTYEVTNADGTVGTTTFDAEGGYVSMANGAETGRGTVAMVNGQTCFNSAEEGSAPECWTDGEPAEDGSWVSTSDDGETVTVKKMAEAAAE